MKRLAKRRSILAWLLCAVCLLSGGNLALAGKITSLEDPDSQNFYYEREFGDSGISVMIPLPYTMTQMLADDPDFKQMGIISEDDADGMYVISGFRDESFRDLDVSTLTNAKAWTFLRSVLGDSALTKISLKYTEEFGEDIPGMRASFRDADLGRHIFGVRDDWMMVLSLLPRGDVPLGPPEDYEMSEDILFSNMVRSFSTLQQVTEIHLPDSNLLLTLPEGMLATVDPYDEYTDEEMVVYHLHPPAPDDQLVLMSLTTVRNEAYAGLGIRELDNNMLNQVAGRFIYGIGAVESDWLNTNGEYPILLVREGGFSTRDHESSAAYHMIALKEDWLLCLSFIDMAIKDRDQTLTLQLHLLEGLLEGDGAPPTADQDILRQDTLSGVIELVVPFGHAVEKADSEDGKVLYILYDMRVLNKAYAPSFETSESFADLTTESWAESIESYAKEINEKEERAEFVLVEEGVLGQPTAWIRTKNNEYTRMCFVKDGCEVNLNLRSHGPEISDEEIEGMTELFRFVEK